MARNDTIDNEKKIVLRGTIGTPNRKRPRFYNILRPYFGKYKSPYRPKIRFGQQVYPWQTHIKRWPSLASLCIQHFASYCQKTFAEKNLYETLHPLPFRGVGCTVARTVRGCSSEENSLPSTETIPIQRHIIRSVWYKYRPFQGKITSDLFIKEICIRSNITPRGSMEGGWTIWPPEGSSPLRWRPSFPSLMDSTVFKTSLEG
ncbi:hypothetical protein IE077_002976 [Cardiosporidium cionae]|uniref:Uncharacterized protein n=1 Tax=Cardiosporidium cionae TaxID=476202 RepID=A0ABQ7J9F9_9APIC|nr:hypothetical protein IE077_002976 [Cardiosporidium cionae]|eukprot:KAF8820643.1 hypothetical protein IE077_002976 [Cardiosporidium cionae]